MWTLKHKIGFSMGTILVLKYNFKELFIWSHKSIMVIGCISFRSFDLNFWYSRCKECLAWRIKLLCYEFTRFRKCEVCICKSCLHEDSWTFANVKLKQLRGWFGFNISSSTSLLILQNLNFEYYLLRVLW